MEAKATPGRAFCPRCGRKYAVPEEELKRRPGVRFRGVCWNCDTPFVVVWRDGALRTETEEELPPPPADDRDILPRGLQVGRYVIEGLIDAGGSSAVYRAFESGANRHVALKVLHRAPDSDYGLRFRREVEVQANLKHPNLMPIFDQGTVDGKPFYTMELLQRPVTLETIAGLFRSGRLNWNPALRDLNSLRELLRQILLPVARAIDFANRQHGILHRDLKPDNILLDARTRRVYVIDFGICHALRRNGGEPAVEERRRLAMGSIRTMPPEQARGEVSPQGDVWALGAILYYLLSGEFPVARALDLERVDLDQRMRNLESIAASCRASGDADEAAFYEARLEELRTGEVRTMRDVVRDAQDGVYLPLPAGADPALAAIVRRAMEKEPKERYPTAGDFAAEIEAWLEGRPVRAHAASLGTARAALNAARLFSRRNRTSLTASATVLLVALAAGALVWARSFSREESRIDEWMRRARAESDWARQSELLGKVLTLRPEHEEAKDLLSAARLLQPLQETIAEARRVRARVEDLASREGAPSGAEAERLKAEERSTERLARDVAAVLERVVLPGLRGLPAAHPGRALEREAASLAGFLRGRRFLALKDPPAGMEILLIPPVAPGEKELDWSRATPLRETLERQEAIPLDPGSYVLLFRRSSPSRSLHLPFRVTRATDPQLMLACPVDPAALPEGMAYIEGTEEFTAGDPRFQERTRRAAVPTFLLDELEVTNARYAEFLRTLPREERARAVPRRLLPGEADRTAPLWSAAGDGEWSFPEGTGDHPVTGISLGDARAFARSCGKRLPTPVEWERAARGADGRDYPFGDALDPRACNAQTGSVAAAGATEGDRSPFGVVDMAGNVAEWTEDGTPGEFAIVKGGSYELPRFHSMAAAFDRRRADLPYPDVGFRCARSVE